MSALEAHIRHLAAITQTPPHYLLGSLVNLSAEALAAAESGLQRKIKEKREVLGEGYEQAFRVAGANSVVHRVLTITGMENVFEIHPDLASALPAQG